MGFQPLSTYQPQNLKTPNNELRQPNSAITNWMNGAALGLNVLGALSGKGAVGADLAAQARAQQESADLKAYHNYQYAQSQGALQQKDQLAGSTLQYLKDNAGKFSPSETKLYTGMIENGEYDRALSEMRQKDRDARENRAESNQMLGFMRALEADADRERSEANQEVSQVDQALKNKAFAGEQLVELVGSMSQEEFRNDNLRLARLRDFFKNEKSAKAADRELKELGKPYQGFGSSFLNSVERTDVNRVKERLGAQRNPETSKLFEDLKSSKAQAKGKLKAASQKSAIYSKVTNDLLPPQIKKALQKAGKVGKPPKLPQDEWDALSPAMQDVFSKDPRFQ